MNITDEVDHSKDNILKTLDMFIYVPNEDDLFDILGYTNG